MSDKVQRWEYLSERSKPFASSAALDRWLNAAGELGWELVRIDWVGHDDGLVHALFKRPVT